MTLPKSYYPPRSDLGSNPAKFISQDCDLVFDTLPGCTVDSEKYAADPNVGNDLDAVAQATPPYGAPYSGTWAIPPALAAGDYAVWVEVNKEFDSNSAHNQTTHPSVFDNQGLASYGMAGNFGQPSVVYRAPIRLDDVTDQRHRLCRPHPGLQRLDRRPPVCIMPPDATITTGVPGSGEGRLLEISGPAGTGRVLVSLENCSPVVCDPPPPAPGWCRTCRVRARRGHRDAARSCASSNAGAGGQPVSSYEIRYLATDDTTLTADEFSQATRASQVTPGQPGSDGVLVLQNLKPSQHYVIGIRSQGPCNGQSDIAMVDFTTPSQKFTQLSGCFVATAAYGSEMEPQVAALRSLRDSLRPKSGLVAAAVDLYYRSGPAAAAVIARSDTARTPVPGHVPAGALPARPDRSDQGQQDRRSPRPRPADRRLARERRSLRVRRHADRDQPGRARAASAIAPACRTSSPARSSPTASGRWRCPSGLIRAASSTRR